MRGTSIKIAALVLLALVVVWGLSSQGTSPVAPITGGAPPAVVHDGPPPIERTGALVREEAGVAATAGALTVRVVDDAGGPFVGGRLRLRLASGSDQLEAGGIVAGDGLVRVQEWDAIRALTWDSSAQPRGVSAGRWDVTVEGHDARDWSPRTIEVREGEVCDVTVVVQAPPAIEGVVVDERGVPVPRVRVRAAHATEARFEHDLPQTLSDAAGHFVIRPGSAPLDQPVRLWVDAGPSHRLRDTAADHPWRVTAATHRWGQRDACVVLQGPALVVRVREAASGEPVTRFVLLFGATPDELRWPVFDGVHEGGELGVAELHADWRYVRAAPSDERLGMSAPTPVVPGGLVEFVVAASPELEVLVQDADGRPAAEADVEVLLCGTARLPRVASLAPWLRGASVGGPGATFDVGLFAKGVTDADGRVRLRMPATDPNIALRVVSGRHPGYVGWLDPAARTAGFALVRLARGGSVRARLGDLRVAVALDRYRLFLARGRERIPQGGLRLDDRGVLACDGVPEGPWSVRVELGGIDQGLELGPIDVRAGDRSELLLDAAAVRPGALDLRLADVPDGADRIRLERAASAERWVGIDTAPLRAGGARFGIVLAGRYRAVAASRDGDVAVLQPEFDVAAGAPSAVTLSR